MPIYRIIECEVCRKKEHLDNDYRKKWFIENKFTQICSIKCFDSIVPEIKKILIRKKGESK